MSDDIPALYTRDNYPLPVLDIETLHKRAKSLDQIRDEQEQAVRTFIAKWKSTQGINKT